MFLQITFDRDIIYFSIIYRNVSLSRTTYITEELRNDELQKKTAEGICAFLSFFRTFQMLFFKIVLNNIIPINYT